MGDADERQGAFLDALAVQIRHAVLGHDVMHARAGRHHSGARAEVGHDARDGAAFGGGRERDDGLATARFGRAAVEIHLSADAGEKLGADRIGANLSREVNLQRRVDRHHFVLLADDERVVDVFGGMKREQRIVVHVIVNLPRAEAEAGHDFAAINGFAVSGDGAALDEFDDVVGDHFGVNAEVFLVLEKPKHRLRNAANAEFNGGTILDEGGNVFGNLPGRLGRFGRRHLQNRRLGRNQHVNVMHVDEAIAQRPRHVGIHLRDDERGVLGGAADDVHRHPETAHAVRVRRRDVNEGHVERQLAAVEQARNIGKEDRRVVAQPFLDDVAHVFSDEEAVHAEVLRQLLVRVRRVAESEQMDNLGVRQFGGAFAEGADQLQRLARAGADEHALAGLDFLHRLGGREDLRLVRLLPVGVVGDGLAHVIQKFGNIQHSTSNAQHPMNAPDGGHWMFDVEC